MRFTTARLCGGEALMAISADMMDLDMRHVEDVLANGGYTVKERDDMMLVAEWKGMNITVYPRGKIMFYPLRDKGLCIKYATELLLSFKK